MNVWLDEMVDGDLGPEKIGLVKEHLRTCTACRADLDSLQAVKRVAATLPRELAPPRDLWDGIERRLEVRRASRPRLKPAVVAVAATIVAAVALAVLLGPDRNPASAVEGSASEPAHVHARFESTPGETFRSEYERARTDLLAVIEARHHQLAPETLEVIESNMRLIDQAIADIENALDASPGETHLDRQLRLAYRQQIELLRWAARLSV